MSDLLTPPPVRSSVLSKSLPLPSRSVSNSTPQVRMRHTINDPTVLNINKVVISNSSPIVSQSSVSNA